MRAQHVGWDRLRRCLTGVGDYLRAGAGRPWRHNSFGGGCRSKTDRRCRGGHGEYPHQPSADVLPATRHAVLATSPAAIRGATRSAYRGLPAAHFGCHVHNLIKWTWQPLIPQVPSEPPHIPGSTWSGLGGQTRAAPPGRARRCQGGSPPLSNRSAAIGQCCSAATINSFVVHLC
jgi:hypothetical protein